MGVIIIDADDVAGRRAAVVFAEYVKGALKTKHMGEG